MRSSYLALALTFTVSGAATAQTCSTEQLTLTPTGQQANQHSYGLSLTADGRFALFTSGASNLVANDTNSVNDVFLRDLEAGTTERVSLSSSGGQGNAEAGFGTASANGRWIAFESSASNLVAGDGNGLRDAFLRDRTGGLTTLVSVTPSGSSGNGWSSDPVVSADGDAVAFESLATDLTGGPVYSGRDVYYRDVQAGVTTLVSSSHDGSPVFGQSFRPRLSANGQQITFGSSADNLVPVDTNGGQDVFLFDLETGARELVSVSTAGAQGTGGGAAPEEISGDGRFVLFSSSHQGLVSGDTNNRRDVFLRDRAAGTTTRVSVTQSGGQAEEDCWGQDLTPDGRYATFYTDAKNLHLGANGQNHVYVKDLWTGALTMVDVNAQGTVPLANGWEAALSTDGWRVAFISQSKNILSTPDPNGYKDVFYRACPFATPATYCHAEVNSLGCRPTIGWSGAPSASAGSGFDVTLSNTLSNRKGILFYSVLGPNEIPFNGGMLCVRTPLKRTPLQDSGGNPPPVDCSGQFTFDFNAHVAGGTHPALVAGADVWAQYWSRDSGSSFQTNVSDALWFRLGP